MGRREMGHRGMDRRGMGASKPIWTALLVLAFFLDGALLAQSTGQTIRHHKVAEQDSSFLPELAQAESAIEKGDDAAAEPLLKKVVAADPNNFQAWFDLGFVYNRLGNTQESIAAYRKSVAAKPDVFESNLNLGLMLAKAGQPDAERVGDRSRDVSVEVRLGGVELVAAG